MINLEAESISILNELKKADSYLDCEMIIINNLRKHLNNGSSIPEIESYLKQILPYLEISYKSAKDTAEGINYQYAAGYVNTLTTTSYWHSWIKTIK